MLWLRDRRTSTMSSSLACKAGCATNAGSPGVVGGGMSDVCSGCWWSEGTETARLHVHTVTSSADATTPVGGAMPASPSPAVLPARRVASALSALGIGFPVMPRLRRFCCPLATVASNVPNKASSRSFMRWKSCRNALLSSIEIIDA